MLKRRMRWPLLWVALAVVLAACGGGGGGSKGPAYTLSGVVRDEDGRGIEGVTLSITGDTNMTVLSGEGGRWTASGVRGTVTVTPVGEQISFDPPVYRISSGDTSVVFTAHLQHEHWVVDYDWAGYVYGILEEKVYGPRYHRTYVFKLRFENTEAEDGRVMVWAYINGVNVGGWTQIVPAGDEKTVEIRNIYYSDNKDDNIFNDFKFIVEGARNVPVELIDVPFTVWHDHTEL